MIHERVLCFGTGVSKTILTHCCHTLRKASCEGDQMAGGSGSRSVLSGLCACGGSGLGTAHARSGPCHPRSQTRAWVRHCAGPRQSGRYGWAREPEMGSSLGERTVSRFCGCPCPKEECLSAQMPAPVTSMSLLLEILKASVFSFWKAQVGFEWSHFVCEVRPN